MEKTLLWELMNQLSKNELRSLQNFIKSPYFNLRKDLILLNIFLTNHILKATPAPDKRFVFNAVFKNESYSDQKLRLTISRLQKLLEKFLIQQTLNDSKFEQHKLLLLALRKRKAKRNFNRAINRIHQFSEQQPLRNPDYYLNRFEMEYQNYLSLSETRRTKALNLEKVEHFLDAAYISFKLRQACLTRSHQSVSNTTYDSALLEEIKSLASSFPYNSYPSITIYKNLISLLSSGQQKEFQAFKEQLFQHIQLFTKEEFRDLYLLALNFCIKKINENNPPFFRETLDMYKKGLELDLLVENRQLSRFTYINIVAIALKEDDLDWVDFFINNYKKYIEKPFQETAFSLNMARLEFARKNFQKALILLQKADYDDLISHMTAKILQLKIYYELEAFESLDSLVQSLKVFIRRKKKIGYHFQIWWNIIHFIHLTRKINPFDKKQVGDLISTIEKESVMPEKEWLIEKLKALIKVT